jgi:ribosomal protein L12E/L44/L45/RPP1/RPP2
MAPQLNAGRVARTHVILMSSHSIPSALTPRLRRWDRRRKREEEEEEEEEKEEEEEEEEGGGGGRRIYS